MENIQGMSASMIAFALNIAFAHTSPPFLAWLQDTTICFINIIFSSTYMVCWKYRCTDVYKQQEKKLCHCLTLSFIRQYLKINIQYAESNLDLKFEGCRCLKLP